VQIGESFGVAGTGWQELQATHVSCVQLLMCSWRAASATDPDSDG
jgi:hypothetical protein